MILKLKSGETFSLLDSSTETVLVATFVSWNDIEEFANVISKKQNLEGYTFSDSEDSEKPFGVFPVSEGDYKELERLEVRKKDDEWIVHACLKGRDMILERLERLEEGQLLQDGVIMEMAGLVVEGSVK